MRRMANAFYRFCLGWTTGLTALLLVMSCLAMTVYCAVYSGMAYGRANLSAAGLACLLLVVLAAGYRGMRHTGRRTSVILAGALVLLQILFLVLVSHPMATSDPARVQNEALLMVKQQHGQMNMADDYFQKYPNNHFIVVVFYYYYRLLFFFGIKKVWIPTVLLNMVCLDAGVWLSYRAAVHRKGYPLGNLLLCLFMLCPTTYVWLTTVYTNTISFPFVMASLLLTLEMDAEKRRARKIAACVLAGTVMAVGYWIRPTTIIPIIAMLLWQLLCFLWSRGETAEQRRNDVRVFFGKLFLICAVFLCCFLGCSALVGRHVDRSQLTGQFPVTHWLMMGLNEESFGGFSRSDESFTKQFTGKAAKRAANLRVIQERMSAMGVSGVCRHAGVKLFAVWALSDDDCFAKASYASDFPVLYSYFMGDENGGYLLFMQAFRICTFALMLVSVLRQLMRKRHDEMFLFSLTFLGAVLFFVLWEANRKYNICFMGVCLLLAADGAGESAYMMRNVWKKAGRTEVLRGALQGMAAVLCAAGVTGAVWTQQTLATQKSAAGGRTQKVYQCRNYPDSVPVDQKIYARPKCLEQTIEQDCIGKKGEKEQITMNFSVQKKKNATGKQQRQIGKKKHTGKQKTRKTAAREYRVEVFSLDQWKRVYCKKIGPKQLSTSGKYTISLPAHKKKGRKGYLIRLTHLGKSYQMIPAVSRFPQLDPYPYGELYVNGERTGYDLSMRIVKVKSRKSHVL